MHIEYMNEDKQLFVQITEEIDHHTTEKIRGRVDYEIQRHMPKKVIFDFDNVSFMDSAGIGMIIGRYKLASMLGGKVEIMNVKPNIRKIFEMSRNFKNNKYMRTRMLTKKGK
ncbi:MAG: anti-sigma factor antagonist [Lachnospiraceae bacterium]|jgi:stage II sporulation protein AA (anti-sigma F factor antagonist)|nr:anti-sigma factor antagonist [Lachnospiraceae bacterium]